MTTPVIFFPKVSTFCSLVPSLIDVFTHFALDRIEFKKSLTLELFCVFNFLREVHTYLYNFGCVSFLVGQKELVCTNIRGFTKFGIKLL